MIEQIPTKDKCKKCIKRREQGYMYCLCGNKLWDSELIIKIGGSIETGNTNQGWH